MKKIVKVVFILLCWSSIAPVAVAAHDIDAPPVTVALETELGSIVIEVYRGKAPLSAGDFLKYVDTGLLNGAGFYRVVRADNDNGNPKIEVIQGGLLDETKGLGSVAHESTELTGLKHVAGAVSLARDTVGTGSAVAFFICVTDQPSLDYGGKRNPDGQGYAVFGQVTIGMDVVRAIQALPANASIDDAYVKGQILENPLLILNATTLTQ
ncbi:peptidylprolyl isomerase [Kordiimonas pumila]|uniref:peptidylprolyl isomerase n=1 Tax=Kordiimonas pumila TaxID=2161677 RepID=A0ABV7D8S4_9PROT|nr:peptidylprolyl isomerase [Kordiimonas pumila]